MNGMLLKSFQIGLSLTCQAVLWLSGLTALIGVLCRYDTLPVPVASEQSGLALALTVWCGGVLLLSRVGRKPLTSQRMTFREFIRCHGMIIPALCLGVLLSPLLFIPYAVCLGLLEFQWWLSHHRKRRLWKPSASSPSAIGEGDWEEPENGTDEKVMQQTVRFQTGGGEDRLEGTFYAEFQSDQFTTSLHVAFCPPFDAAPNVEAYLLDDTDAKLSVFEPKIFGVRIDVKRGRFAKSRFPVMVTAVQCSSEQVNM